MAININISSNSTPVVTLNKVNGNVVLVPLLYAKPTGSTSSFVDPKTRQFSTSGAFKSVYKDIACWIGTKGSSTGNRIDKSYVMIEKLLDLGWDVVVKPIVTSDDTSAGATTTKQYFASEAALATELKTQLTTSTDSTATAGQLEEFKSRNLYDIKFISSGAYDNTTSNLAVYSTLAKVAEARGDCMALFELSSTTASPTTAVTGSNYAMMFWPACYFEYKQNGYDGTIELPAAFAYLSAFANSTVSNPDYYAAVGAQRGVIPGLIAPKYDVGEKQMATLQAMNPAVNAIMPMLGYGYRTYGNKTATQTASGSTVNEYLSFANVMILINDITKAVYKYTMGVMFNPNDDITWNEFTVNMDRVLSPMVAYRGIKNYRWTRITDAPKGIIKAKLTIVPIEAVEEFDITFDLVDEDEFNTKFVDDSTVDSTTTANGEV